jgi:hypothetical protein
MSDPGQPPVLYGTAGSVARRRQCSCYARPPAVSILNAAPRASGEPAGPQGACAVTG